MARVPLPPAEKMALTVLAEIASGGMGSVEMARVESGARAGQVLAIKRLHSSIANDQAFVDMFLDEAWLTAAMKSPHVMAVIAHGTDERGMFLAVELIEGVPLSRLIKESRVKKEAFSEQVVACITMQLCEGLLEAHTLKGTDGKPLGLVHRDLTPGNVLVGFDGNVKIVDFGIAKAEERITHTRTGTMKGKPAYMSPEQAKGSKTIDLRADLFSLGVMIFELIGGRRPWMEKSAFDVIMSAALKPHPNIAEVRQGVSKVWGEIIDKCLAKKATERWPAAADIRDKLAAWQKSQNFAKPDVDMLREFVVRNSAAQIEWFRRARLGEFAKGNAQTFKELEEAIDDARRKSGEGPMSMAPSMAPPISSGRAAFDAITPSKKVPANESLAGGAPTVITPISARPPTPSSDPTPMSGQAVGGPVRAGTTQPSLTEASRSARAVAPAPASQVPSTQPLPATEPLPNAWAGAAAVAPNAAARGAGIAGSALGGTIALSEDDLLDGGPTKAEPVPQHEAPLVGLGGTAFLEVSPLKGMKLPEPRIESAVESPSESDLSATIRMPELSDRPVRDVDGSSRSVVRPAGALVGDDDMALGATMRSDEPSPARDLLGPSEPKRASEPPKDAGMATTTGRSTGWNLRNQAQAQPPPPKGLSGTTVLLLILVAFVAGGAIAAWVAKTYLIKPAGALEAPAVDLRT